MRNYIQIGYLGFTSEDIKILEKTFELTPKLANSYRLINPAKLDKADIVLVNADNSLAIKQWEEFELHNFFATPLALSAGDRKIDGMEVVKLPVEDGHLVDALEDIVSDRSIFNIPDENLQASKELQILVVDSSYSARKDLKHKLNKVTNLPIRFSFAASGAEAIIKLIRKSYDMILLDFVMESMDCYTVCKSLKDQHTTHVVILTSENFPFDEVRAKRAGCDGHIVRPVTSHQLYKELEKCFVRDGKTQNEPAKKTGGVNQ